MKKGVKGGVRKVSRGMKKFIRIYGKKIKRWARDEVKDEVKSRVEEEAIGVLEDLAEGMRRAAR